MQKDDGWLILCSLDLNGYLCIKLCQEVKVLFEVGGQDGFND